MPATVDEAVAGLNEALGAGSIRQMDAIADNITPPVALIALNTVPTYHGASNGGLATYEFRVTLVVDNLSNRSAISTMNAYASYSGATSVRALIEADTSLGGRVQTCVVERLENVGSLELGRVRYLAGDFIVTVYA